MCKDFNYIELYMSTYRELVYLVLDEIKGTSDDFTYTEEHIMFLLNKYRAFLLKQRYSDIKKQMPESNYQTICLDLTEVPAVCGEPCEGGPYLKSTNKVPFTMQIGAPRVYPINFYQGDIAFISRDRMRYIGYNRFLQNIIYCSIAPDGYLYFKSFNPQFLYLEKVRFTAIFQDSVQASKLQCSEDGDTVCDILDFQFPIEDALIPPLVELVVRELGSAATNPSDNENNAKDDIAK